MTAHSAQTRGAVGDAAAASDQSFTSPRMAALTMKR